MSNATQIRRTATDVQDGTRLIESRFYPPSVAVATAWHRYRWAEVEKKERRAVRLTRRGRIVRDMTAGAAVLSLAVFTQDLSHAYFGAVLWLGQFTGTAA
jgi:hypothetical protein